MRPKAKQPEPEASTTTTRRPISITAVVDPVAAMASGTLRGSVYLCDTNKNEGSTGLGTEQLRTRVRKGDQLLWNVIPLECETYTAIAGILIDRQICEPEQKVYPGTDISYWSATVKQDITEPVPYRIQFRLGTRAEPITTELSPALVGPSTGPGAAGSAKE